MLKAPTDERKRKSPTLWLNSALKPPAYLKSHRKAELSMKSRLYH